MMLIQEAELEQWLRDEGSSRNKRVPRSWHLRRAPEAVVSSPRFSTDRVDRRPRLKLVSIEQPRRVRKAMAS